MGQVLKTIVSLLFKIYYFLILVRVLLSLRPKGREYTLFKFVYRVTDPVLGIIRRGLPPARIGFDASPFIVLILIFNQ